MTGTIICSYCISTDLLTSTIRSSTFILEKNLHSHYRLEVHSNLFIIYSRNFSYAFTLMYLCQQLIPVYIHTAHSFLYSSYAFIFIFIPCIHVIIFILGIILLHSSQTFILLYSSKTFIFTFVLVINFFIHNRHSIQYICPWRSFLY